MKVQLASLMALLLLGAAPPAGSRLTVQIVDAAGAAVENAVVTIKPDAGLSAGARYSGDTKMAQQNISFAPHVLIVPVGATVQFPNKDKVRHHVYSFSKPARFEMKLYSRDETRSHTFTVAGTVALGCNIHDSMSGFIKVVDTPFAAKTNASGIAVIERLPAGKATITIWHERLKNRDNEQSAALVIPAGGASKRYSVALR